MSKESLKSQIAGLRAELTDARDIDPALRDRLHGLARDIEAALERRSMSGAEPGESLGERLSDRVRALEVSHPRLSATVGNLVDTLALCGL